MDSVLIGNAAAITVSFFWAFCSILFTAAGKRVGALSVNSVRILMAIGLLGAVHIAVFGLARPDANGTQWAYMGASGVIGLALGDLLYFSCLVVMGPRRGVLLMATNPIFSVIAAYLFLGESLGIWALVGIAVTLAGVFWVIAEREEDGQEDAIAPRAKTYGILLGIGGSACQGIGLVLSKYGMENAAADPASPLSPLSATLMRMVVAGLAVWVGLLVAGKCATVLGSLSDRRATGATFGGAIFGPFLGVWLSMVAISYTYTGVAATLMSLMPVIVIPIVWVLYRQKTSWRGFLGAVVAIAGVAILFLM